MRLSRLSPNLIRMIDLVHWKQNNSNKHVTYFTYNPGKTNAFGIFDALNQYFELKVLSQILEIQRWNSFLGDRFKYSMKNSGILACTRYNKSLKKHLFQEGGRKSSEGKYTWDGSWRVRKCFYVKKGWSWLSGTRIYF